MKANKKTMLAAALAVAVVALAGVGYAALGDYKATTVNSDNGATAKFITVTQTGDYTADFGGVIDFYTYTDATHNDDDEVTTKGVVYSVKGSDVLTGVDKAGAAMTASGKMIGTSPLNLEFDDQTGLINPTIRVKVSLFDSDNAAATLPTGWDYYIGFGSVKNVTGVKFIAVGETDYVDVTPTSDSLTAALYIAGPTFATLDGGTLPSIEGYGSLASSMTYGGDTSIFTGVKVVLSFDAGTA